MTGIHVVPDRQYIGLRQVHTLYRIDSSMIGTHQLHLANVDMIPGVNICLLYTSPSPRDKRQSRMPSSA